jgi:hypothetical protein
MEPKTTEQISKIIVALNECGFKTDSVFIDYRLFEGSQVLKFDFSSTDPSKIMRSAIQQAYRKGFSLGGEDAQLAMREALGL